MKRFYQTLFLSLAIPLWTHAQTTDTTSFSLDECIKYALENTVNIKNSRIDEQIAESKVKETVGLGLPQIDGKVGITHNQKLPRFFSQYSTQSPFFTEPIPGIQEGDVIAMENFFQLKSSADASISINQLLFSSSYLVGLKAAGTYKELAYRNTEQTKIELIQNVTKAYYAVLVNNERIVLFDNNIGRVDSLLRNTKALNQNGFAEAIDVDRIQVQLNNLKSEKLKFLNSQSLSLALLKFQMNYPMDKDLPVEGDLASLSEGGNLLADEGAQTWDYKNRIEYKVLETQRDLQKLDIKNKFSNSTPRLSAFANLGYTTQSPGVGGLFKTESNNKDEFGMGPDKWYSYSNFGLTLNVPIFSGLQRTHQVQQAKLSLLKLENNFSSLKQSIDLSIEQNTITFENAKETLKVQEENMKLAANVARVTKIKYEQGVGSNIEVIDAESSLRESQVNYYNALYDAIVARVDLDKAYAKIDPSKYVSEPKK